MIPYKNEDEFVRGQKIKLALAVGILLLTGLIYLLRG